MASPSAQLAPKGLRAPCGRAQKPPRPASDLAAAGRPQRRLVQRPPSQCRHESKPRLRRAALQREREFTPWKHMATLLVPDTRGARGNFQCFEGGRGSHLRNGRSQAREQKPPDPHGEDACRIRFGASGDGALHREQSKEQPPRSTRRSVQLRLCRWGCCAGTCPREPGGAFLLARGVAGPSRGEGEGGSLPLAQPHSLRGRQARRACRRHRTMTMWERVLPGSATR